MGKEANVVNVDRFGTPSHSLFISTNFWSFRQTTKIEDEDGSVVYRAKSRAISLHDKTTITDVRGGLVAKVEKKVLTLREYHRVTMADGLRFDIAHDLFQVFEDTAEISALAGRSGATTRRSTSSCTTRMAASSPSWARSWCPSRTSTPSTSIVPSSRGRWSRCS